MLIGIDLDSVIADIIPTLNNFVNDKFGTKFTISDYTNYGLSSVWKCSRDEAIDRVYDFYQSSQMDTIAPVPGSIEGINYLKQKHDLVVITSRPTITKTSTLRWIQSHFPNTFSKIILSNQFSMEGSIKRTKGDIGTELGIKAMIDDHIEYVEECTQCGIQSYLFEAPWNKAKQVSDGIIRMSGWSEVQKYF